MRDFLMVAIPVALGVIGILYLIYKLSLENYTLKAEIRELRHEQTTPKTLMDLSGKTCNVVTVYYPVALGDSGNGEVRTDTRLLFLVGPGNRIYYVTVDDDEVRQQEELPLCAGYRVKIWSEGGRAFIQRVS
jgi:hypothetical protein